MVELVAEIFDAAAAVVVAAADDHRIDTMLYLDTCAESKPSTTAGSNCLVACAYVPGSGCTVPNTRH